MPPNMTKFLMRPKSCTNTVSAILNCFFKVVPRFVKISCAWATRIPWKTESPFLYSLHVGLSTQVFTARHDCFGPTPRLHPSHAVWTLRWHSWIEQKQGTRLQHARQGAKNGLGPTRWTVGSPKIYTSFTTASGTDALPTTSTWPMAARKGTKQWSSATARATTTLRCKWS